MVKGNAVRRKELAQRRKDDKKEEIERKQAGPKRAIPAEARSRLLSDARLAELAGHPMPPLTAWVISSEKADGTAADKDVCESWLRTGSCALRRCKASHEMTVSHLQGVPSTAGSTDDEEEEGEEEEEEGRGGSGGGSSLHLPALETRDLRLVDPGGMLAYDRTLRTHIRGSNRLIFVASGDVLVFDHANGKVFAAYVERQQAAAEAVAAAAMAAAVAAGEAQLAAVLGDAGT
jgi:hypothetical protein